MVSILAVGPDPRQRLARPHPELQGRNL